MTGFARWEGALEEGGSATAARWSWEIRSVNARGLEARFRLPPGFDYLEPALRKSLAGVLSRGAVTVSLSLRRTNAAARFRLNEEALVQVLQIIEALRLRIDCDKPRADQILAVNGVLERSDEEADADATDRLGAALLGDFANALERLKEMRACEGEALASVISGQLDEIGRLSGAARAVEDAAPDAIARRLAALIYDLLAAAVVAPERLAEEAAVLAVKADVREELDRLEAHVAGARDLVSRGGVVGRKLDFLAQEFNREANTLCSKAATMRLKRIGLDLKSVIDQMREQVQNIE